MFAKLQNLPIICVGNADISAQISEKLIFVQFFNFKVKQRLLPPKSCYIIKGYRFYCLISETEKSIAFRKKTISIFVYYMGIFLSCKVFFYIIFILQQSFKNYDISVMSLFRTG